MMKRLWVGLAGLLLYSQAPARPLPLDMPDVYTKNDAAIVSYLEKACSDGNESVILMSLPDRKIYDISRDRKPDQTAWNDDKLLDTILHNRNLIGAHCHIPVYDTLNAAFGKYSKVKELLDEVGQEKMNSIDLHELPGYQDVGAMMKMKRLADLAQAKISFRVVAFYDHKPSRVISYDLKPDTDVEHRAKVLLAYIDQIMPDELSGHSLEALKKYELGIVGKYKEENAAFEKRTCSEKKFFDCTPERDYRNLIGILNNNTALDIHDLGTD